MIAEMKQHQEDRLAQSMSRAFFNDGLLIVLRPDESKRHDFGVWFWGRGLEYTKRWGRVFCNEDATAGSLWLPPENSKVTMGRVIRAGFLGLPFKAGPRGAYRFLKLMPAIEKMQEEAVSEPHWHLFGIGVEPGLQGKGIGSQLMEVGLDLADSSGQPCYLETGTEENVRFYSKRGFEVKGQVEFYGFTVWAMVRQPGAGKLAVAAAG